MANRSTNIKGRVLRNLKRHGYTVSDVTDDEIYDELSQAQNNIISEVQFRKVISITLQTDEDTYPLTTGDGKSNIASVKLLKLPTGWRYKFSIVDNDEFIKTVNENPATSLKQPVIGTVIENSIKLFPVPSAIYNNVSLEFWCTLKSSREDINGIIQPEIPAVWDKALELYATSQFLSGDERTQYLSEYANELRRLRPMVGRDNHPLQRNNLFDYSGSTVTRDDYTFD